MKPPISANEISTADAFKLLAEGDRVLCPVCSSDIVLIPRQPAAGKAPVGLECPVDQKHFLVYQEHASTLLEMRARRNRPTSK
jgi:hypothetical protein